MRGSSKNTGLKRAFQAKVEQKGTLGKVEKGQGEL
jgi:hypothetical protein